mgnify:CR=1 FL=1
MAKFRIKEICRDKGITQKELAEKYVNLYCEKTGTDKKEVQRWIPIVAAIRKTKGKVEEQEMLDQWINIVDYE